MKKIVYPMHCAPRCGAKTRSGHPCKSPAIHGKARCRMHGGKSTGRPSTPRSILKKQITAEMKECRELLRELKEVSAKLDKSLKK